MRPGRKEVHLVPILEFPGLPKRQLFLLLCLLLDSYHIPRGEDTLVDLELDSPRLGSEGGPDTTRSQETLVGSSYGDFSYGEDSSDLPDVVIPMYLQEGVYHGPIHTYGQYGESIVRDSQRRSPKNLRNNQDIRRGLLAKMRKQRYYYNYGKMLQPELSMRRIERIWTALVSFHMVVN
ncbi:hypothetical protein BT96DRAFT_110063 [Gymnopus androsaceus JB14]|uniref:Uncharacterized protein n=1 Tax=Gymnopus androsaceus JB14 TaxID=1447944 RepID=A0A6A4HH81_9AGAR|nr:hypothetical protein BT96DRAFT_110063 [Gymnopus androsaceus JB14]